MHKEITLLLALGVTLFVLLSSIIPSAVPVDYNKVSSLCIMTSSFTGVTNREYNIVVYSSLKDVSVQYRLDWGDGSVSNWSTFYNTGKNVSFHNRWIKPGIYEVSAQYRTSGNITSAWSDPITVIIYSDLDMDGWSDIDEIFYKTNIYDSRSYPADNDLDHITDSIDNDDDDDSLQDHLELALGSDPYNNKDVKVIFIDEVLYYLVDIDNDGSSDVLYNPQGTIKRLRKTSDGSLLIDVSSDKKKVYLYNTIDDKIVLYSTEYGDQVVPWYWMVLLIIGIVILIIFILFKIGVIYIYEEEIEV
ncbi:MAG: hypothetical protein QXS02_03505 [Candidatus Thermoplasmatota archaeon]